MKRGLAQIRSVPLASKQSFLRAFHVLCAGGSGVRSMGKTHTNFFLRDCSSCRLTQEHNDYIPKHFTIGVPKELLLWGQSVGLFLQMVFFNSFGHSLHVRSSVHLNSAPEQTLISVLGFNWTQTTLTTDSIFLRAHVCPLAVSPFYFSGPDFSNCRKERAFLVENSALKRSWRLCKSFEKSVSHQIIRSLLQIQKLKQVSGKEKKKRKKSDQISFHAF